MEFVSVIVDPIVKALLGLVKKQLGYLSKEHVMIMASEMKKLHETSIDVKNHMERNLKRNQEISTHVSGWLEAVAKIEEKAQRISSIENGCLMRYNKGRKAFKTIKVIENLIQEEKDMIWSDAQIPLGRVMSKIASTSTPSDGDAQNPFKSREKSFKDALSFLQQDQKSQVIALYGMGGVGKTTMMEQLKKTVEDKKMFDYVVKVTIGQQINMSKIQQAVAVDMTGESLTEPTIEKTENRLRIMFEKLPESKRKVLLILDDVWETIELKHIGLSPFPNSFKLLLTSRDEKICKQYAAVNSLAFKPVRVDVMEESEAQFFFWKIAGVSNQQDKELNQIGRDIVSRCGFLPLAIKLIATALKFREANAWRDQLCKLKYNNLNENVQEIIKISYDYIREEEGKAIFLLCGLFPDDFNIPIEELTRYAWGLRLLNQVYTLGQARDRTETCVQDLISANLLIDSDDTGCVKMHDLVLSFVLGIVSKGDHPWVINHGDISKLRGAGMNESCKHISVTCTGMSEFPTDFRYPNASLLRLMNGDKSLRFPEEFYKKMKNLEVIAYEKLQNPLLSKSLQCSTKIRTLILDTCSLVFDCSAIGYLKNLEVLSFAHCGITYLPSAIGNLKELKLLDLTGCVSLRIDDGVLNKLVNLEELYMKASYGEAIRFTEENHDELAARSTSLFALEVEFFGNSAQPKNMLFTKLERFRISMGCGLGDEPDFEEFEEFGMHSYKNTLKLVTNKEELSKSRLSELFGKVEVLYLEVKGMEDLPQQVFNNLRVLNVYKCTELKYLFTVPIASGLINLKKLTVSKCLFLEVLVYCENGGAGVIKFQELTFLSLDELPNLVGFCNTDNLIELPQLVELRLEDLHNFSSIFPEITPAASSVSSNISRIQPFFNKEVLIPKLEILKIERMDKLTEIWPNQVSSSDEVNACVLRNIEVYHCVNLVNLFPINPMSLLDHLEELDVSHCGSIESLFNIDMSCAGEIQEYRSNLRLIGVYYLQKLKELWRMKGESNSDILMRSFQAVERIDIRSCKSFVNVFTPTITSSDVRTLMKVSIDGRRPREESWRNVELVQKSQEIDVISMGEISEVYGNISDVEISVNHLKELLVDGCKDVEVVFEIESSSSSSRDLTTTRHNHQPLQLPYLKDLHLQYMLRMSHVWKCNWNKLVIPQNQSQSSFHNLTTIDMVYCHRIKYLFTPLMGTLLPNLKNVFIRYCNGIEEVVSNGYDEMDTSISTHTNTISFPHLDDLTLVNLPRLKSIDGGNAFTTTSIHDQFKGSAIGVAPWFLCQYSKMIIISMCDALSRVFPSYVVGQLIKLEQLTVSNCMSMVELFEFEGVGNNGVDDTNNAGNGSDDACTSMTIPRSENMTLLQLPNLRTLQIYDCEVLEYIFTSSTLESLKQLKELTIKRCNAMQVIVREDREHTGSTSTSIVFPHLKSLTLEDLPNLKGFFLGMNEFQWPLLEKVTIYGCPQMEIFTSGHSKAPTLKYIHTSIGKHSLECGLNFHLSNATHESRLQFSMCSHPDMIKLLQFPWSFSNLVEVNANRDYYLEGSRVMFPCTELLNLENLEKLCILNPFENSIKEIFEVVEGSNDDVNETQSVVVFKNLKEVTLGELINLKHMWKSNRWIVLNFPNLTKVSIDGCPLLGHVFTGCMVGSLSQLQELQVIDCKNMDVIVKEVEDSETRPTEVVFPSLKSIILQKLPNLNGFYLGKEAFVWPSLDTLEIKKCPKIAVFTSGQSTTPELKFIDTTFGLCHATEDPNSFIKTKQEEGWQF